MNIGSVALAEVFVNGREPVTLRVQRFASPAEQSSTGSGHKMIGSFQVPPAPQSEEEMKTSNIWMCGREDDRDGSSMV